MPHTRYALSLALAITSGVALAAAPIAPNRYRTAEGVEVIVGRDPAPLAAAANPNSAPSTSKARATLTDNLASAPASTDGTHRVSEKEQTDRDRERVNILTNELVNENRALDLNHQALKSPRASVDLDAQQLQALRASAERHEANIKALTDELRRASGSKIAGP
jgi:uncharacterized protein involved in exopolysaccharide biosynthesis